MVPYNDIYFDNSKIVQIKRTHKTQENKNDRATFTQPTKYKGNKH